MRNERISFLLSALDVCGVYTVSAFALSHVHRLLRVLCVSIPNVQAHERHFGVLLLYEHFFGALFVLVAKRARIHCVHIHLRERMR